MVIQTPSPEAAIVPVRQAIDSLWKNLREVVISDDQTLQAAVSQLASLKTYRQRLEDSRTALVKPLNEHVKFINGKFKETTELIDKIEVFVKRLMSDYRMKQETARLETERLAREAAAAVATTEAEVEIAQQLELPIQKTVRTESGAKLTFKTVWLWEVVDIAEVPSKYKTIVVNDDLRYLLREADMIHSPIKAPSTLIASDIQAGVRNIPGLRIYSEEIPAVGGR